MTRRTSCVALMLASLEIDVDGPVWQRNVFHTKWQEAHHSEDCQGVDLRFV